jgi:hypothetical protein
MTSFQSRELSFEVIELWRLLQPISRLHGSSDLQWLTWHVCTLPGLRNRLESFKPIEKDEGWNFGVETFLRKQRKREDRMKKQVRPNLNTENLYF